MDKILIEPHFLPTIEYFTRLIKAEEVILDLGSHYVKQTYRNRAYILGANKVERLTIPVSAGNHTPYKDVRISYDEDWVKPLWRTISSAYANAPFFIHYAEECEKIFCKKPKFLVDLNQQLLTLCLKFLSVDINIKVADGFIEQVPEAIYDLRSVISPKQHFCYRNFYKPAPYMQLFGSNFEENLSIIDLIFCEGPNARLIVIQSDNSE